MSVQLSINRKFSPYQEIKAFEDKINTLLFNQIVKFVSQLVPEKVTTIDMIQIPWFKMLESDTLLSQYRFRYLGEVLERYEEKIGSDIKNVRAIALALGCLNPILTDNMFVGDQKTQFINTVEINSKDDLYLAGACYLLAKGTPKEDDIYRFLTEREYNSTEELVFILSLFDNLEQQFEVFLPHLVRLLGTERSLNLIGNMGVILWVISYVCPIAMAKKSSKGGLALLKSLYGLNSSVLKVDGKHYEVLLKHGYSHSEIVYANFFAVVSVPYKRETKSKDLNSIIAEKVTVAFLKEFLNKSEDLADETYELIDWGFRTYKNFPIKIEGFFGIQEAIAQSLIVQNPNTFVWIYQSNKNQIDLQFDILDHKWDSLYQKLGKKDYWYLFCNQLPRDINSSEVSQAFVLERLTRYTEITGDNFCDGFKQYPYQYKTFKILVELDIIDLQPYKDSWISSKSLDECMTDYLCRYTKGISSRKAFEVFLYLYKHREQCVTTKNMQYLLWKFYDDCRSDCFQFIFKKSFLTKEEQLLLFSLVEEYVFLEQDYKYIDFLLSALQNEFFLQICPREQLRSAFDQLLDKGYITQSWIIKDIKAKLYSEVELKAEAEKEKEREAAAEQKRLKETEDLLQTSFTKMFDGTFQSIERFLKPYYGMEKKVACRIIARAIKEIFYKQQRLTSNEEVSSFLSVLKSLINASQLSINELKVYVNQIQEV